MENKKGLPLIFIICAVIIGSALLKQFDFQTLKFEKPALAVVYIITFIACIFFIIKYFRNRSVK